MALPQLIVFILILNNSLLYYSFSSFGPEIASCPVFPVALFFLGFVLYLPSAMALAPGGPITVPVSGCLVACYLSSFSALQGSRNDKRCGHLATVPLRVKESGQNSVALCR